MMKKLFFILTFLFFNISARADDNICATFYTAPDLKMTASYGHLTYDYSKSTKEITALAQKFNLAEEGLFAQGLSTVNINFDITIYSEGQPIGNSQFCVIPSGITIFLGLESPTIYISNQLPKDSCEYNIVVQHEKVHQQINKTTLEYYLPMFKYAAEQILKQMQPKLITDINAVETTTAEMTKLYNQKLTPLVDYIKKEMLNEQHKLDNPKNYFFESTLCP